MSNKNCGDIARIVCSKWVALLRGGGGKKKNVCVDYYVTEEGNKANAITFLWILIEKQRE